jgi:hypothetical protein
MKLEAGKLKGIYNIMIKQILFLLESSSFFGIDEDIDIAKGKYEAPTNFEEHKIHKKRNK